MVAGKVYHGGVQPGGHRRGRRRRRQNRDEWLPASSILFCAASNVNDQPSYAAADTGAHGNYLAWPLPPPTGAAGPAILDTGHLCWGPSSAVGVPQHLAPAGVFPYAPAQPTSSATASSPKFEALLQAAEVCRRGERQPAAGYSPMAPPAFAKPAAACLKGSAFVSTQSANHSAFMAGSESLWHSAPTATLKHEGRDPAAEDSNALTPPASPATPIVPELQQAASRLLAALQYINSVCTEAHQTNAAVSAAAVNCVMA